MYKATTRKLVRYALQKLNEGDSSLLEKFASPDIELGYPGDNSWSTMFRPAVKGRSRHVSHQGLDEARAFAERFIEVGAQIYAEDILVNGPPSNTRVAVRAVLYVPGADGTAEHNNRAVLWLKMRWGRIVEWEDYNDSERTAAWDEARAASVDREATSA